MNKYPKISIVTPVLNKVRYIEQAILSVINQNYPNLEYIIIDGGSTDGTLEIIKKYEKHLTFWISEKDNGMYDALNKGFKKSTGEIMAWLNADDKYHKNSLFVVAGIFNTFEDVEWITGIPSFIDEKDRIVIMGKLTQWSKYRIIKSYFYEKNFYWIQQESTFWKRSLWKKQVPK